MPHADEKFLFTSESVTEGHPDKIADQISDAVLDAVMTDDPTGRVACETLVTTGLIVVAGEITTSTYVPISPTSLASVIKRRRLHPRQIRLRRRNLRRDLRDQPAIAGHRHGRGHRRRRRPGLDVRVRLRRDSRADAHADPTCASASPHKLAEVRKKGVVDFLRPDGKSQVTIEYVDGRPVRVDTVVISTQHSDKVSAGDLHDAVLNEVIKPVLPAEMVDKKTKYHINPTGRFVTGGPMGDCGLTGRKIIVDTYGGYSRHGGGALSGKDPTKVDRSACYMARYVAKNIVAAGLATKVEVQIAYAIGVAEPVSVMADTFGTGTIPNSQITELIRGFFKLTPKGIIETLDLRRPIYRPTAAYGHFGRTGPGFTWERTDKADAIRKEAGSRGAVAVSRS